MVTAVCPARSDHLLLWQWTARVLLNSKYSKSQEETSAGGAGVAQVKTPLSASDLLFSVMEDKILNLVSRGDYMITKGNWGAL